MKQEIGVVGMGVMGKSLSRNLARNGFKVSLYNRHVPNQEENVASNFLSEYPDELSTCLSFDDLESFVQSLESPRKLLLMINAGKAIDEFISEVTPFLSDGDMLVDGGNSHFEDTKRRMENLMKKGLLFIGAGISGGEKGALLGPSIMPSGDRSGYTKISNYLETIAAKDSNGLPCCTYVGLEGSGHFVKMIHNGIEYAEMQLLAECYHILKMTGHSNESIAAVFESWMEDLGSYLLEISIRILRTQDTEGYILDRILDKAGNKGTGNWATMLAAELGVPSTMIPAALFSRYLSFFKENRVRMSELFPRQGETLSVDLHELKDSYQFARVINHCQGFQLIGAANRNNDWGINLSEVARIWTNGCIIKSDLMTKLSDCLKDSDDLMDNDYIRSTIRSTHPSIKRVVSLSMMNEVYIPCLCEALNFFHGLSTANSSANMIQAQRDYFGAHTYQRIDDESGAFVHTKWEEQ